MAEARTTKKSIASLITKIAVLSAISFILYLLRFSLPFMFPSFLDFQVSDLPALLGGFALGTVPGCLIILFRGILKLLITGTQTSYIGDMADLIIGCTYVIVSSLVYRSFKSKKGAAVSLAISSVVVIGVAILLNRFILIPFYSKLYTVNGVLGALKGLFPDITAETMYNYYLPLSALPFNFLRCLVTSVLCFALYKRLSPVLHMRF